MISTTEVLAQHFPSLNQKPKRRGMVHWLLGKVLYENEFQAFSEQHPQLKGLAFIEQAFSELNVSYQVSERDRERIPTHGKVVIVANHPIGSLDGLALLLLVGKLRQDVKIVANEILSALDPLSGLLLPVNNMSGNSRRSQLTAIGQHLELGGAVIIFPAGEVSRLKGITVQDGRWSKGFLNIATKAKAPILPICVRAKNSKLFYLASTLYKPLSTLLLVREIFTHRNKMLNLRVGELIPVRSFANTGLDDRNTQAKLMRKHLYRIGKKRSGLFQTEAAIAHPVSRQALRQVVKSLEPLGMTPDGKQIYLSRHNHSELLLAELGRLREIAFRAVGEGTGLRSDTDRFDADYMHLLLWDDDDLEVAGAYRFADSCAQVEKHGLNGLYSHSLFNYSTESEDFISQGLELGRSFVQPRYWGKRSLDYLWIGIGAFLAKNPQYRYLFGPVSISGAMPEAARDLLIHFYQSYFPPKVQFAHSRQPYQLAEQLEQGLQFSFKGDDYKQEFSQLKSALASMGTAVPTLYKQYTELCKPGGVQFIDFNVDPDFNQCIDGLVLVDMLRLKDKKRKRYIAAHNELLADSEGRTVAESTGISPKKQTPETAA
ncbi:GNAT family N-acyltransferase [Aliagarivorans marinus]|uniref:GNAT family N-acyltransferase n=1 Tax=Aliagarivorans marinus TaxID=561965 RepID=UPI00041537EF|nr:lysophospholipid acyltransferase family protein [Aliagarivorans marinus]